MKELKDTKFLHFPNLDALRFLAFFSVFINHVVACLGHKTTNPLINTIKTKYLLNGSLGVNFFFVLSGFLITYLLSVEKNANNKINVRLFYLKRILRIWPLYFLVLFIGLVIIPNFTTNLPKGFPIATSTTIMNKDLYLFFLGNFDYVRNGISNAIVGVLWSVSVEEQFYLFWPLVLAIVPRKHLVKVFIAIVLFSISYRLLGTSGKTLNLMQLYHTFSSVSDLAVGAIFAQLVLNEKILERIKNIKRYWIILFYIVGISLIIFRMDIFGLELTQNEYLKSINFKGGRAIMPRPKQYFHAIMPVIYSLFFGFIIVEQVFANRSLFKVGKIPFLTKLGKISYGLYCFHMIALFITVYCFMKFQYPVTLPDKILVLTEAAIAFVLTILISSLSYQFFEKRFLNLKERLALKASSKPVITKK